MMSNPKKQFSFKEYENNHPQPAQDSICHVFNNVLEVIGNTPLVKLNKIPKDHGLECDIYVKCEFMNPGGSVKDRIACEMLRDAERRGVVTRGAMLVEPSSGNTGIGLAIAASVCGYRTTIVSADKNSDEKMNTLKLLGADIIQAPSTVAWNDPRSYLSVCRRLLDENHDAVGFDQYNNKANSGCHYVRTGAEIISALKKVDVLVVGVGTGGTISGVAHKVKEHCPSCVVVGVGPDGSVLLCSDRKLKPYKIEGIGGDFVPGTFDRNIVDEIVHVEDKEAFLMAREVIRKEGILCGGSSGAAMSGTLKIAKKMGLGAGTNVVVVFPDGIRNYMTKFVTDQWMEANLYQDIPHRPWAWWKDPISKLKINDKIPIVNENSTCYDAIKAMNTIHLLAIVVDDDKNFLGVITKDNLRNKMSNSKERVNFHDKAGLFLMKNCYKLVENENNPTVGLVSRVLDITPIVVIVDNFKLHENKNQGDKDIYLPKGIVTSDIVWNYITEKGL